MNMFSKKILAASIVACAGTATNAAEKAPTLADILKASEITLTGYVDTSYTHLSGNGLFTGGTASRVYDTERRSFNLHTVDVAVGYQPANGVGAFVQIDLGSDADVTGAIGTNKTDNTDVQEAFVQYASGALTVIGGKFATLAGAEVIESPSNTNFSRSILFGYAIPFTHTGVRAAFAPSDKAKFYVGVNNGWDVLKESAAANIAGDGQVADSKTFEFGASASVSSALTLAASLYTGDEVGGPGVGSRELIDLVATFNVSDALSFTLNYDSGSQERTTAGEAKWDGIAAYANFKINDLWRVSARAEQFDDKNGFRTGVTQEWKETTLTLAHMPAKNLELRGEVRYDKSNVSSFQQSGGGTKSSQDSFAIEAIYKF